jgi:hypothetical protein
VTLQTTQRGPAFAIAAPCPHPHSLRTSPPPSTARSDHIKTVPNTDLPRQPAFAPLPRPRESIRATDAPRRTSNGRPEVTVIAPGLSDKRHLSVMVLWTVKGPERGKIGADRVKGPAGDEALNATDCLRFGQALGLATFDIGAGVGAVPQIWRS